MKRRLTKPKRRVAWSSLLDYVRGCFEGISVGAHPSLQMDYLPVNLKED